MFTHGLTADHTPFDKQTEYLRDKLIVITWDMPLYGEGSRISFGDHSGCRS
ncbi:hypothetical protein [Kineothrix sedimenti]|uniref:Uncharacterized protein n=1 Tax=Kineothrix sedimenti TaxID=3123317 RepID=A0ABZ3EXV7_9FIRM